MRILAILSIDLLIAHFSIRLLSRCPIFMILHYLDHIIQLILRQWASSQRLLHSNLSWTRVDHCPLWILAYTSPHLDNMVWFLVCLRYIINIALYLNLFLIEICQVRCGRIRSIQFLVYIDTHIPLILIFVRFQKVKVIQVVQVWAFLFSLVQCLAYANLLSKIHTWCSNKLSSVILPSDILFKHSPLVIIYLVWIG